MAGKTIVHISGRAIKASRMEDNWSTNPYTMPQGAGLLLAESVVGARNALHSKAPRLLTMLLAEDIVKASELKTDKVRSVKICASHFEASSKKLVAVKPLPLLCKVTLTVST